MASWLKAAEDLFEVVDRRAKLVVAEISDEQTDFQPPGSQVKKASSRTKGQKRVSKKGSSKRNNAVQEQTSTVVSQSDEAPDKDGATLSIESEGSPSAKPVVEKNNEQHHDFERDDVRSASSELPTDYTVKGDSDQAEISASASSTEAPMSTKRGDLSENASDVHVEHLSLPLPPKQIEVISDNYSKDAVQNNTSEIEDVTPRVEEEGSKSITTDSPSQNEFQLGGGDVKVESPVPQKTLLNEVKLRDSDVKGEIPAPQKPLPNEVQLRDGDVKVESLASQKKQLETKAETPMRVQDQLDEAQGLLKTTNSAGQSKEARLARICAGLSSRLQEYKSENAQLEELLIAERELSKSYEVHIKQLQQELSASKSEVTRVESNMADALAAKNSEIEALLTSMDTLKKQAALSEGNLASLQANMESIMRNRELTETRMMQAIREELASAERRAEEERAAHNATKMSAMEREVELEHRAVEASTALARIQRIVDERTSKATELEQKVALLEVECASLNQELQDMEARVRRGQKKSPEEANQMIQMQAWQEEVERARQGQRDAESKLSSLEAEMQKMRVAMAAMKRDAEHYSRQEHMELEKRYRELTDLLYYKQTQLETMATEKAAAEFQLEKEIKRLQEVQVEAERSRVTRRASSSWEEDTEMNSLEPLPLHHRHMAAASIQLQKAAKLLDSGAVRATRFLWRYPTARVILLFYLVFVHLFLMYLLHRLQEQADDFSAREVAESMGLSTPKLP